MRPPHPADFDAILSRIALRAASETDAVSFLQETLSGAIEIVGALTGAAYLCRVRGEEPPEELLVTAEAAGTEARPRSGGNAARPLFSLQSARRLRHLVGEEGEIVSLADPLAEPPPGEPRQADAPEGVIAVPLISRPQSTCLLLLVSAPGRGSFEEQDLLRCRKLARLLAPMLGTLVRVRELEEMIVRDDIAGCYNRRHLEDFLAQEAARARRFRTPLSLIFLDLDDLKAVNSAYGHNMGSLVLKEVAHRVSGSTRRIDKLFRFGGDEFCIILPETDIQGALEVAERVRAEISARPFLQAEIGGGVNLTASLGLAAYPVHASTAEELLASADAAMRRIKTEGKNRVWVAEPRPPGQDGAN